MEALTQTEFVDSSSLYGFSNFLIKGLSFILEIVLSLIESSLLQMRKEGSGNFGTNRIGGIVIPFFLVFVICCDDEVVSCQVKFRPLRDIAHKKLSAHDKA